MNWKQLKEFCNSLNEEQLEKKVILWREDETINNIEVDQLQEDRYIKRNEPEEGCFPLSEFPEMEPKTKIKRVYKKGDPILWEKFD